MKHDFEKDDFDFAFGLSALLAAIGCVAVLIGLMIMMTK